MAAPAGGGGGPVVRGMLDGEGGSIAGAARDGGAPGGAPRNLIYTVVLDAPGAEGYRFLGKMLVSSLLRTFFTGDVVVFRNFSNPLFLVERKGLEEVYVETPQIIGQAGAEQAWCWKYKVAPLLDVRGYDKVLFLDADTLALRNVDHLLEGDCDIAYQVERRARGDQQSFNGFYTPEEMARAAQRDGVNSGTLAVRASIFHEVMREWERIDTGEMARPENGFRDQASWNALLMRCSDRFSDAGLAQEKAAGWPAEVGSVQGSVFSGAQRADGASLNTENLSLKTPPWKAEAFPMGEIQFPMYADPHFRSYTKAALTHNCGGDTLEKIRLTYGLYMQTFFCDESGLFFSMLEM